MNATVTNIKYAADKRDRMEAYHLCESVLPLFEEHFGECLLLRSAMVGALDYANGIIDKRMLAEYHRDALHVISEAAQALLRAPKCQAERANGGILAAYAILQTLEPVIDLIEVQRRAEKAFSLSSSRRAK